MVEENFSKRKEKFWKSFPIELEREYVIKKQKRKKQKRLELIPSKFNKFFNEKKIQDKFKTIKVKKYELMQRKVLKSQEIDDIDALIKEMKKAITGETSIHNATDEQISDFFNRFMVLLTKGFNRNQSHHAIRTALYKSLKKHFKLSITDDELKIQKIVTSPTNADIIRECISDATSKYKAKFDTQKNQSIDTNDWEIPETDPQKDPNAIKKNSKYIMDPFYNENFNNLESAFISKIMTSKKCKWWYRNKNSGSKAFAVAYEVSNKFREFFVDFIVRFEDGRIGLYDTKGQGELDKATTRIKAITLGEYIKKHNTNRKKDKLLGGIIANTNSNYQGEWKINKDGKQPYDENKFPEWDTLDLE